MKPPLCPLATTVDLSLSYDSGSCSRKPYGHVKIPVSDKDVFISVSSFRASSEASTGRVALESGADTVPSSTWLPSALEKKSLVKA